MVQKIVGGNKQKMNSLFSELFIFWFMSKSVDLYFLRGGHLG